MSVGLFVTPVGFDKLRRAMIQLSHLDISDLLEHVGGILELQTRRRINDEKKAPDGTDWKPLSKAYEDWKIEHHPHATMLILEGHMRDSIESQVNGYEVEVGSNMEYAVDNQAERPFLGVSDDNEEEIETAVVDWMRDEMGVLF